LALKRLITMQLEYWFPLRWRFT